MKRKRAIPMAASAVGLVALGYLLVQRAPAPAKGEAGKAGCRPEEVEALAARIAAQPRLALRGLMSIPVPHADPERRRPAFRRMRGLFEALSSRHAGVDTLSMGMSDDFAVAIAEGATMVRIGTALFGPRNR